MTATALINAMMASAAWGSRMSMKGWQPVTVAIVLATLIGGWMFRYESGRNGAIHTNRFTGAVCQSHESCWFTSSW